MLHAGGCSWELGLVTMVFVDAGLDYGDEIRFDFGTAGKQAISLSSPTDWCGVLLDPVHDVTIPLF